jgi:uncharacterized protein (DUF2336 family)
MSDNMATMAQDMTNAPHAAAARPRISADAFRNLTARLKKPDALVPTISPVIVQQPIVAAPFVEPPYQAPVVAQPEPEVIVAAPIQYVEPVYVEPVYIAPVVEVAPVLFDYPPGFVPQKHDAASVVDPTPSPIEAPIVAEQNPQSDFADNFTYVPQSGEVIAEPALPEPEIETPDVIIDKQALEEAVREEVAQRQVELELENIWRLLLAKPSGEDRAIYLREAAEIIALEGDVNAPAAEHDLSQIEPAHVDDVASAQTPFVAVDQSAVPVIPEGQDIGELSRSLLDMMASGAASGLPQERALAADTLLRLVPRMELKPLVLLSQRLSKMDAPPDLLLTRLIRDPRVEVSGPLLEDCAHISDKDLELAIEENEPAKLRLIARRRKLSRAISDALIKSGEPSVVLTLVRNKEAEISHFGFESLLVLCEFQPDLLAPLATRQDLSAPFAFELFWQAPAQLRRYILSRFLTDSETLTKILKITLATQSEDENFESEPLSQHALLEGLERAARGQFEIASEELANTMQVSPATVARILNDVQGEALVVMLKAAAYPRSAVTGLLKKMQQAELPVVSRDRDVTDLQSMFETLSFNKARILLTYWDWAQGKTGPYAPVQ